MTNTPPDGIGEAIVVRIGPTFARLLVRLRGPLWAIWFFASLAWVVFWLGFKLGQAHHVQTFPYVLAAFVPPGILFGILAILSRIAASIDRVVTSASPGTPE